VTRPADRQFDAEVCKLLLQVAWADDAMAPEEAQAILEAARGADLAPDALASLEDAVAGKRTPPPPNLGVLKARRDEAMTAARRLIAADGEVTEDEAHALELVRELLDA
jgi:hypothetical protein